MREQPFHSISTHHYIPATVGIPFLRVAARRASKQRAAFARFPELGLRPTLTRLAELANCAGSRLA